MLGLRLWSIGALAALATVAGAPAPATSQSDFGTFEQRVARGFKIAPVPLNLAGSRVRC
jgi:hypothetical protein